MEAIYGPERAAMLEVLQRRDLLDEITRLGGDKAADTILHIDLKGRNPDEGATEIPYSKGSALLRLMEVTVGRDRFDAWLKSYFDRYAFQSITTAVFVDDVKVSLLKGDADLANRLRLEEWIYQPGLPDNAVVPRSERLEKVDGQVAAFVAGASASSLATGEWTTQEWQHFLAGLPAQLTGAQLADLDRAFGFTRTGNSEVLFAWLRIAIRHRYEPARPALERFLTTQGRRKFLRPLFEDLMATDWGKAEARGIYSKARPLYHAVSASTLDGIVK
jgi:hypothetical protein